jgi:hypothetical protein
MTTQTEFAMTGAGMSQCDKILGCLRENRGKWVAMPDLVLASDSFNVHSRISELRDRGHTIEHREEREVRKIKSFYRIVE